MRHFIYKTMRNVQDMNTKIECQKYPGYKNPRHDVCGKKYIKLLSSYLACFTCCSTMDTPYLISKFFEIPGSGSLLVAYDEHVKDQLKELGFIDGCNYISVTQENFVKKLNYILDPQNRTKINTIRYNGYELIESRHLLSHRSNDIDNLASLLLK